MRQDKNTYQTSLFDDLDKDAKELKIKINRFLDAVPHFFFSDTGFRNIANRFKISVEQVKQKIKEYEARNGLKL